MPSLTYYQKGLVKKVGMQKLKEQLILREKLKNHTYTPLEVLVAHHLKGLGRQLL